MRIIDLHHQGMERVIGAWEVDGVLVDPGPESALAALLDGLGEGFEPRAILLTHIHFDHAGATGALLRRWPDVPVFVHERGARHMADPERLVASATRLYGEEGMQRLWGEVVPVPAESMTALSGGETVLGGEFRVAYTPGHASHHVAYFHEGSGRAFVGDVAGVTVPPSDYVMAPTPPPDLDVEAWERSMETVLAWGPSSLGLTHFGPIDDVARQVEALRRALREQVALADGRDSDDFIAAMREKLAGVAGEQAGTYAEAAPLDHLYLGIDRWRTKFA